MQAVLENMKCGVSVGGRCIKELRYDDNFSHNKANRRNDRNVEKSSQRKCQVGPEPKYHRDQYDGNKSKSE